MGRGRACVSGADAVRPRDRDGLDVRHDPAKSIDVGAHDAKSPISETYDSQDAAPTEAEDLLARAAETGRDLVRGFKRGLRVHFGGDPRGPREITTK